VIVVARSLRLQESFRLALKQEKKRIRIHQKVYLIRSFNNINHINKEGEDEEEIPDVEMGLCSNTIPLSFEVLEDNHVGFLVSKSCLYNSKQNKQKKQNHL
jgi:hypothetical protein